MLNYDKIEKRIIEHRRILHEKAEVGFKLEETKAYVKSVLSSLDIVHQDCGRCGVVATLGMGVGRCILLRADMDALPIKEENCLEFSSKNGNMHACGHDMHTAMLLGAAEILSARCDELSGSVKLMFQPAEETLEGALDMIISGVLERPRVDAGVMIHVLPSENLPIGTVILPKDGVGAPSADFFEIVVKGKAAHGASPASGIDALTVGSRIVLSLDEIIAKELLFSEKAVLTVGSFSAGNSANTIAESALILGTLRTFDEGLRAMIKARVQEIVTNTAKAFRTEAEVRYTSGAPVLKNSGRLSEFAKRVLSEKIGENSVCTSDDLDEEESIGGSEDFAYVAERVEGLMIGIVGTNDMRYGLHNPKSSFDERCLLEGSRVFAELATAFLNETGLPS